MSPPAPEVDDLNISFLAGADDQAVSFNPELFDTVEIQNCLMTCTLH
jgi:hypothetical protein